MWWILIGVVFLCARFTRDSVHRGFSTWWDQGSTVAPSTVMGKTAMASHSVTPQQHGQHRITCQKEGHRLCWQRWDLSGLSVIYSTARQVRIYTIILYLVQFYYSITVVAVISSYNCNRIIKLIFFLFIFIFL